MKTVLKACMVCVLLYSCTTEKKHKVSILRSNVAKIAYTIDGKAPRDWTLNTKLKPDRLKVETDANGVSVGFISDIDSVFYTIKEKDTVQFNVVYQRKDSALTEIVGIPKNAHFSDAYIALHKGQFKVEVPEVHELANIMVAISKIGQLDENMVDNSTEYHKEVLRYFLPYKNHPAIDLINKHITKVMHNESYYFYYALKMNACGYRFNKTGKILNDGVITKMGFSSLENPFEKNKELFEDFAKKSKFRKFYKQHSPYFNELIKDYKVLNPIRKMQNWLEKKFYFSYGSYLVTFSPLVGGAHSTQKYKDNGFEQTVMFVCRSEFSKEYNANVNEMLNSRVVFTEIDHNFVNPTSEKFKKRIQSAFKNRAIWANDSAGASPYGSPLAVFNEYMTFGLFSLYCIDTFSSKDVALYVPIMEGMMKNRGFINFDKFNQQLINIHKEQPESTIEQMYATMLLWSVTQ